jgi:hypothetical protein
MLVVKWRMGLQRAWTAARKKASLGLSGYGSDSPRTIAYLPRSSQRSRCTGNAPRDQGSHPQTERLLVVSLAECEKFSAAHAGAGVLPRRAFAAATRRRRPTDLTSGWTLLVRDHQHILLSVFIAIYRRVHTTEGCAIFASWRIASPAGRAAGQRSTHHVFFNTLLPSW